MASHRPHWGKPVTIARMNDPTGCPFCAMLTGAMPRARGWRRLGAAFVAFEPLSPVTPGHMLVVPRLHCTPADGPSIVGGACNYAAALAVDLDHEAFNLIVSNGAAATQTIEHAHVHLLPRHVGDGLVLPWAIPASVAIR